MRVILSPRTSGPRNMSQDIEHFENAENQVKGAVLRIYSWQPRCISLGYSQNIEDEIKVASAKELGWDIVKRPTGGGLVFHNEAEITYSFIIGKEQLPAGLVPSFEKISEAVVLALKLMGVKAEVRGTRCEVRGKSQLCFSRSEGYEIVVDGKKIVGAAQKRGKKALLQQGSIYIKPIEKAAYQVLKRPFEEPDAVCIQEILGRIPSFDEMSQALESGFSKILGNKIYSYR